MQTILIAVTIGSAAVAVTMCAIVIRMLREQRRRSDARVEALLALADGSSAWPQRTQDTSGHSPKQPRTEPTVRTARAPEPGLLAAHESDASDLPLNAVASVSGVDGLFADRDTPSPWGRRLGVAATFATLVAVGALAIGWLGGKAEAPGAATDAPAAVTAPLELLSLRHAAESKTLTISGLVQNPRGGTTVSGVTAVAFLFASDGSFLGSGRAPLDFTELKPGDESPFVVQVPISRDVARYRVSFRNSDGQIIAHVDRRADVALAQKDRAREP